MLALALSSSARAEGRRWVTTPPDVRAAWDALVAAPVPAIGAEIRDSATLLSRDVLGYAPFGFADVRWPRLDLNRDGQPEILFVLDHPTFCGMAACALVVMGRVAPRAGWTILCETQAGSGSPGIRVLPMRRRGWHWFRSEITTAWRAAPDNPTGVACHRLPAAGG